MGAAEKAADKAAAKYAEHRSVSSTLHWSASFSYTALQLFVTGHARASGRVGDGISQPLLLLLSTCELIGSRACC